MLCGVRGGWEGEPWAAAATGGSRDPHFFFVHPEGSHQPRATAAATASCMHDYSCSHHNSNSTGGRHPPASAAVNPHGSNQAPSSPLWGPPALERPPWHHASQRVVVTLRLLRHVCLISAPAAQHGVPAIIAAPGPWNTHGRSPPHQTTRHGPPRRHHWRTRSACMHSPDSAELFPC
jgi:hypothetical protein